LSDFENSLFSRVMLPIILFHCCVIVVSCFLPIMMFYCHVIYCMIIDDRKTRTMTILNCVYREMRDLAGRGAGIRLWCTGSNISKPNRQIYMQRGLLEIKQ
jgi:hypothetical protein